jgi:glycosyltransferase involved in cell wall biosynthesis
VKILLLAPHPFYQERGTPIAVNLLLRALSAAGHRVDVLTYHEGAEVSHPNVTVHRIPAPPFVRHVPPGPSLRKIACDKFMVIKALAMARRGCYDVVHAVEESAFMALGIRRLFKTPYLYDMDSLLSRQIAEKFPWLAAFCPLMRRFERAAIRGALAVVPMCDALADAAAAEGARRVVVLRDVSLLGASDPADERRLREEIRPDGVCCMYVGNLESYQGIDLLLESFRLLPAGSGAAPATLVVAGGTAPHIRRYAERAAALGLAGRVRFIGPQPVSRLAALLAVADVLVSPRARGNNTPMKIYSYLAAGKAILATDLPTHTQVLTPDVALLAPPQPPAFAAALARLVAEAPLRQRLGAAARALAERSYALPVFDRTVRELYDWVALNAGAAPGPRP